jgi:hypothetical protein
MTIELPERLATTVRFVLVWVMKVPHQACPERSAVAPTCRDSDAVVCGGTDVATAVALKTN